MSHIDLPQDLYEKLEDLTVQYGASAGKLALAMDLISDAEIAAGVLSVYCRNGLDPRKPHPDVVALQKNIKSVRDLVKSVFRERNDGTPDVRPSLIRSDWE